MSSTFSISTWMACHNHWSTETTMLQYIKNIIEPYISCVRDTFNMVTTPGVIIMANFKWQVTEKVSSLLEKCHLHVCLLLANTTDLLQPMDISVNKPAKSFLKEQFSIMVFGAVIQAVWRSWWCASRRYYIRSCWFEPWKYEKHWSQMAGGGNQVYCW